MDGTGTASTSEDSTWELFDLLQADAPAAATCFERKYREALVRFCWGYLGNMDESEDAVQEITWKVICSKPPTPGSLRSWVYKIARYHCLNLLRHRVRRPEAQELPAASFLDAALTGQLTGMVRDEQKQRLQELVACLSEEHREVLRLRYVETLSRSEIAEILELSESVVKSRLFEGLKKLRLHASDLKET